MQQIGVGLREALMHGYQFRARYHTIDLSCMRHGLNSFSLDVTFKDGASASSISSMSIIGFHDAVPIRIKGKGITMDAARIAIPDQQLIDDMHTFGVMTHAAYINPCTNQYALERLGASRIEQVTFKWLYIGPIPLLRLCRDEIGRAHV